MSEVNQQPKSVKQQVPKIRFEGFSENWKEAVIGELLIVNSGKDYKHLEKGNIPVYGTGGYMLSVNQSLSDKDSIGIGRKGTINKPQLLKAPFWTVDTLFHLEPKKNVDLLFSYNLLQKINWLRYDESTGVPSLSKATIVKVKVKNPELKEQTQIGNFFQELDKLIELQTRTVELAETHKKAMLQKMFPQKGEKAPKVRFEGFHDDWKVSSLGDIADIKTGKLDANAMKEDGDYDFYTSGIQKYKIDIPAFEGPAITIAGNGATVGYMHYADGLFNAYQRTYVLTNFQGNREFIYSMISSELPQKIHQEARTGSIPYIVMDMLTDLGIYLPSIEEQTKIGNYFQELDRNIETEKKKLEQYQTMKRAMLQRMFV